VLLAVLPALGLAGAWLSRQPSPGAPAASGEPAAAAESPPPIAGRSSRAHRAEARALRDLLRAEILRAMQRRVPAGADPGAPPGAPSAETARAAGRLRDRLGGREALVDHVNREFMPLCQECIEQAQERAPQLRGMLAIGVETLADEDVGAVVDVAQAMPENEIPDPDLLECVRESALSLTFPAGLTTGREKFMLTLRIDPPDAGLP
jgi:hypothetical protein